MVFPRGAVGCSAVFNCGINFPDHTLFLFVLFFDMIGCVSARRDVL